MRALIWLRLNWCRSFASEVQATQERSEVSKELEKRIAELERRLLNLEARPVYVPYPVQPWPQNPPGYPPPMPMAPQVPWWQPPWVVTSKTTGQIDCAPPTP